MDKGHQNKKHQRKESHRHRQRHKGKQHPCKWKKRQRGWSKHGARTEQAALPHCQVLYRRQVLLQQAALPTTATATATPTAASPLGLAPGPVAVRGVGRGSGDRGRGGLGCAQAFYKGPHLLPSSL